MWCHAVRVSKKFHVQFPVNRCGGQKEIRLAPERHNRTLLTLSIGNCEFCKNSDKAAAIRGQDTNGAELVVLSWGKDGFTFSPVNHTDPS